MRPEADHRDSCRAASGQRSHVGVERIRASTVKGAAPWDSLPPCSLALFAGQPGLPGAPLSAPLLPLPHTRSPSRGGHCRSHRPRRPSPTPGRLGGAPGISAPFDDRAALEGILFVLHTG